MKGIQLQSLQAPAGYRVSLLASDLPKARHMVLGTQGTLFVGSMAGNVYALTLRGSEVTAQRTVMKGLTDPSGVAFRDGSLFVADRTRILRFDGIEQRLDNPGTPVVVIAGLPDKSRHDAHAMNFGPDGKLYVSVGSPCDTCEASNDEYGTIVRTAPDGTDNLGLERPNDELNRVGKIGDHFGFPYCQDGDIVDPALAPNADARSSPRRRSSWALMSPHWGCASSRPRKAREKPPCSSPDMDRILQSGSDTTSSACSFKETSNREWSHSLPASFKAPSTGGDRWMC